MGTKLTDVNSIEQILQEMTLEEKARIVTGGSPFATEPMEKYGIPAAVLLDGATGFSSMQFGAQKGFQMEAAERKEKGETIDRESFGGMGGLALGMKKIQEVLAAKAKAGEKAESQEFGCYPPGMFLGATWNPEPNVNIHRDPLGGRVFEGYSEDPYLVSKLAPEFVKGVEEVGLGTSVKHFAANNQETDRHLPCRKR